MPSHNWRRRHTREARGLLPTRPLFFSWSSQVEITKFARAHPARGDTQAFDQGSRGGARLGGGRASYWRRGAAAIGSGRSASTARTHVGDATIAGSVASAHITHSGQWNLS